MLLFLSKILFIFSKSFLFFYSCLFNNFLHVNFILFFLFFLLLFFYQLFFSQLLLIFFISWIFILHSLYKFFYCFQIFFLFFSSLNLIIFYNSSFHPSIWCIFWIIFICICKLFISSKIFPFQIKS